MKKDVKISLIENGKLSRGGWLSIVAFLLVAVIALSVALGLVVKAGKDDKAKDEAFVEAGGMVLNEETQENGITLLSTVIPKEQYADYGIALASAAEPETAYTVTAVVEPEGATDTLSWSVQWKGSSDSWNTTHTVTDYVTVRSTGDRTATVECKQAFRNVVQLKVAAASAPSISATKDINYLSRVTSIDFYPFANGNRGKGYITVGQSGTYASSITCSAEYGEGTVRGTIDLPSVTIEFSDQYCQAAMRPYITQAQALVTSGAVISTATSKTIDSPMGGGKLALSWNDFFTATGAGLTSIGTQAENLLKSGIVYMSGNGAPGYGHVKGTVVYTYGDIRFEFQKEAEITKIDASALSVEINSLSFSDSSALTF